METIDYNQVCFRPQPLRRAILRGVYTVSLRATYMKRLLWQSSHVVPSCAAASVQIKESGQLGFTMLMSSCMGSTYR